MATLLSVQDRYTDDLCVVLSFWASQRTLRSETSANLLLFFYSAHSRNSIISRSRVLSVVGIDFHVDLDGTLHPPPLNKYRRPFNMLINYSMLFIGDNL
jgi:hypothetical protein